MGKRIKKEKRKAPEGFNEKSEDKKTMTVSGLRNNNGFTLVEIIVAMGILTIALLGLVSVTVMVIKSNSFSKTMTTATTLAKDKMEQLKNTGYDSLAGGTDTVESIYTRTWTVTSNSPAADMKTIEVKVEWNWQGAVRNVTLRSIVAK
ncbi:MAG: prepilin-type N-terminal cleavage/methylation domain-containing protein [Proteobacteria bacterium]|nr:prepilin-type N-terminal cleavage/methylation domain-containing protein [Pseudomonadota bacterium]